MNKKEVILISIILFFIGNILAEKPTPILSKESQIFKRKIELLINMPDSCIVYYTTNGKIPTRNDNKYYENTTLRFDTSVTITAKAFRFYAEVSDTSNVRWEDRCVVSAIYTKKLTKPEVTIYPILKQDSVVVVMSNHEIGSQLFYTTDGSDPDTSSKRYEEVLHLSKDVLLRVFVYKKGSISSDIWRKD